MPTDWISTAMTLYREGHSLAAISRRLGVSRPTVSKHLRDAGVEVRTCPQLKRPPETELRALYAEQTIPQIATRFGVSPAAVSRWFETYGIAVRPSSDKPDRDTLYRLYVTENRNFSEIGKLYSVSSVTIRNWCKSYDIEKRDHASTIRDVVPQIVATKRQRHGYAHFPDGIGTSKGELEMTAFLNEMGQFVSTRGVLPGDLELDAYDANRKFAVEYCGLWWHSEAAGRQRLYHHHKLNLCRDLGIRLITIYEDEWQSRGPQVRAFLRASLGVYDRRIAARKCLIRPVEPSEAKLFMQSYHILGEPTRVEHAFGLSEDGVLLGVVTFASHHRQNQNDLVLSRLAFRTGVQIVGGASKLVQNAHRELRTPIITWSDDRWTDGDLYARIGFCLDDVLKPDYAYTDGTRRRSKQSSRKSLVGCPPDLTEGAFMKSQGWYRIWDCGKKRWRLK